MTLFISHFSALDFWLDATHDPAIGERMPFIAATMDAASLMSPTLSHDLLRRHPDRSDHTSGPYALLRRIGIDTSRIHLLVDNRDRILNRCDMVGHLCSYPLPTSAFVSIGDNICVASPELCFLQLAMLLPTTTLIEVGYLLCAEYTPGNPIDKIGSKRPPLSTCANLSAFLDIVPGAYGTKPARYALRYIRDKARSLMEITLAMSLTLPKSLHGHALPMPALNEPIWVDKRNQRYTQRGHLVADLFWPEYQLDVEYDSDEEHLEDGQRALDANRPVILERLGVRLITVTRPQMRSVTAFRIVESAIRDAMGKRRRPIDPTEDRARQNLRTRMMRPWHFRYEKIRAGNRKSLPE